MKLAYNLWRSQMWFQHEMKKKYVMCHDPCLTFMLNICSADLKLNCISRSYYLLFLSVWHVDLLNRVAIAQMLIMYLLWSQRLLAVWILWLILIRNKFNENFFNVLVIGKKMYLVCDFFRLQPRRLMRWWSTASSHCRHKFIGVLFWPDVCPSPGPLHLLCGPS